MIDTTTFNTIIEIPAVKRLINYRFVKNKLDLFESFVNKVLNRKFQTGKSPTRKRLSLLNWFLINAVVLAYFAGKANAQNISEIAVVYGNFKLFGIFILVANLAALFIQGIGFILKEMAKIVLCFFAILLAAFVIYWLIKKTIEFFSPKTSNETN